MIQQIAVVGLQWYRRWLSPLCRFLGAECRSYPTCSMVALRAFATLPWPRALGVIVRQVGACHSWRGNVYPAAGVNDRGRA